MYIYQGSRQPLRQCIHSGQVKGNGVLFAIGTYKCRYRLDDAGCATPKHL